MGLSIRQEMWRPRLDAAFPAPVGDVADCADAGSREAKGAEPFLAADIGATHVRLGFFSSRHEFGMPILLAHHTYRCAEYPLLEDIVRCFCAEFDVKPRELVLACAGYMRAGVVVNKNLAWPVILGSIGEALGLDRIRFVNDSDALTHAIAHVDLQNVDLQDTIALKGPQLPACEPGPVVIIGPGTALGAAVRFPGSPPRVQMTEAGQIQLAAREGLELQVLGQLALPGSHTSYESVLSGPGLLRIYAALCALRGRYPVLDKPADIALAALAGQDHMASEALTMFCGWLGSFASDLVLLYGATGGVYLAGGFLQRLTDFMRRSPLVERFLDKGVMRPFLHKVPIRVVDQGRPGLMGAASWYLDVRAGERESPGYR